jgi:hypothetical protein
MKNKNIVKEVIKAFAVAFLLLFIILFWQFLTLSDAQIETNGIEFLGKFLEHKEIVKRQ